MSSEIIVKRGTTLIMRVVVLLFALAVSAFALFLIYIGFSQNVGGYYPILIGTALAALPVIYAVYHTLQLLRLIDDGKAFSKRGVNSLLHIMYSGFFVAAMFTLALPYIYIVADRDDAPGVILIALSFIFVSGVVGVFAALCHLILSEALRIKSENDLTV